MTSQAELEAKFWNALAESPLVMLGLQGVEDSRTRPMSAHLDGHDIWFFAVRSEHLVEGLAHSTRAVAAFASKGHTVFANIHGTLTLRDDRKVIDRLWTSNVAGWYKQGKDDPEVALLHFDTEKAEIWETQPGTTMKGAIEAMLGDVPGKDRQGHKAEVTI